MKKFSKFAALALAFVMCATVLASCGGNKPTAYLIGGSGPLTGEYASYGTSVQNGAMLAIKEINANGGLNGVEFKLDMKDDQGDAEKAQNAFNSLYSDGMHASIGSVTSGACVAFATAAAENDVFVLTPSASDAQVITVGDNVFRVCFGDPDQGKIAADELSAKYAKVGCLYDTSIDYSKGLFDAFKAQMTVLGKTEGTDYVAIGYPEKTTDFATYIDQLKDAGCDVIFLPIYYEAAGLVAKAAAAKGYNVPIFGADGLDGVAKQIDETVTATVSYITPFDVNSTDPAIAKFVADYKAAYGYDPDQFAAGGYDAVMIIFNAMKKAGVDDVNITAEELNEILCKTITADDFSYTGFTGTDMVWDETGACTKAPMIVEVKK